jgi:predicted DNA-binding transcriptional regulator AlpA
LSHSPQPRRVLRLPAVQALVPLSDVQIWRLEREGRFPRRHKLVEGGRAVGWFEDEVIAYVNARTTSQSAA